jgi:hypothetical protein
VTLLLLASFDSQAVRITIATCSDPTCILLPPRQPSSGISEFLVNKIIISLSTRFDKSQNIIRQHFAPENVEQWARVRRLEGGDDMNASSFARFSEDRRDATYVRVSLLFSTAGTCV